MSVIVAVRVRPFNTREKELKSRLCVKMKNNTTTLVDDEGNERNFTFDFSYWSHDGFAIADDGMLNPTSEKYTDQMGVYNTVGKQVLKNAMDGYNCCLFAYGQTGSGKSYSMIGYGPNKGIVPIISEEIFNIVKGQTSAKKWFEVNVSMLEIYNEKVQDLLVPVTKRKPGGLKIRESKAIGVYVQDLTKHPVTTYEEIEKKMADGNCNKTIASTQMNASSSRAHTIITIEFKQLEMINGKKTEKFSGVNLVDLAGSEKISKTGATGDRLKEGCSINKSLTNLGIVISALADKAMGKGKGKIVPYRNSSLTRILQNALGGNSKTLMICALSPSSNNYDETLSTLRYADQAKKIKCHAVINESETDKKIRELQNENEELKKLLQRLNQGDISKLRSMAELGDDAFPQQKTDDMTIESDREKELERKIRDLEENLKANTMVMEEYEKTFEEKLKEEKELEVKGVERDNDAAHLTNLNEDPMLCNQIYHNLEEIGTLYIGRKNGDPTPHIILHGISIQKNHARIVNENGEYFIMPENQEAAKHLYLNGDPVVEKERLYHLDRITFGISSIFLFKNPKSNDTPRGFIDENDIDWEKCQIEVTKKNTAFNMLIDPEEEKKRKERYEQIEMECQRIKKQHEDEKTKMQEDFEAKVEQIKKESLMTSIDYNKEELIAMEIQKFDAFKEEFEETYKKQLDIEKEKKEKINKEFMDEFKEKDKVKLENKLVKINPNVIEANLIAQELKRNISFKLHISYFYIDMESISKYEKDNKKYRIKIKVENHELGYCYFWDLETFSTRYYMIKDLLEEYHMTNSIPELAQDDDPFWDPPSHLKVGDGYLKLMSLAYLMDNNVELIVVGDDGEAGLLEVNLIPLKDNGEPLEEDDSFFEEFTDNPHDLIGERISFQIKIG